MRVFIVSAEAVPFAKVGGLADVVGSLPIALRQEGIDARIIMPGYGFIEHFEYNISLLFSFPFSHHQGVTEVSIYSCVYEGVPVYLVQGWPYFGQDATVYTDWSWDVPRFIFFNQLVMAVAWQLRERLGWFPDVFHANDWHTGLLPFLIAENRWRQEWSAAATVMTIHNIAYQGDGVGGFLWSMGIPGRDHPLLNEFYMTDNLLATSLAYSDMISTVSPTYAMEIQHEYAGYELAPLIRARKENLLGILNGIDTVRWDPDKDKKIAANFNAYSVTESRGDNKRLLQYSSHLPVQDRTPVIGVVSRLTRQKAFDLAVPALRELLPEEDFQIVVLGTGEDDIEHAIGLLEEEYPDKVRAYLHFDATLARHIYAGCDLFLMPSHFEPCGMGQMLAMRYGALPLVRATGGLADTVVNYDGSNADGGTGFVFEEETPQAVLTTIRWALQTYTERPQAWRRMQRRAMLSDFGWAASARQYRQLYQQAIHKRKEPVS